MLDLDPRTKFYILIIANLLLLFHLNDTSRNLFIVFLVILLFLLGKKSVGIKLAIVYLVSFGLSLVETENKILLLLVYMTYSLNLMLPCIYSGILFCSTTHPAKAVAALRKAKISEKIIIPICVLMRFFPTLWQEIHHIHNAMKIRGLVNMQMIICKPFTTFEHYIIPILMSASSSAQDLTLAVVCKGIENKKQHTCIEEISIGIFDILIIGSVTLIIGIGVLNIDILGFL